MKYLLFLFGFTFLASQALSQTFTQTTVFDGRVTNGTAIYSTSVLALTSSTGTANFDTLKLLVIANPENNTLDSARATIQFQCGVLGRWGSLVQVDTLLAVGISAFYTDSLRRSGGTANKAIFDTLRRLSYYNGTSMLGDANLQAILNQRNDWKYRIVVTGKAWGNTIANSGSKWTIMQTNYN